MSMYVKPNIVEKLEMKIHASNEGREVHVIQIVDADKHANAILYGKVWV